MKRHVIDRPRYLPSGRGTERFVALSRRGSLRRVIAGMRARKGAAGPARLQQYLRIARGWRA